MLDLEKGIIHRGNWHRLEQVMAREDLKHCPHGRPICITLSKKQLEKQFRRT